MPDLPGEQLIAFGKGVSAFGRSLERFMPRKTTATDVIYKVGVETELGKAEMRLETYFTIWLKGTEKDQEKIGRAHV